MKSKRLYLNLGIAYEAVLGNIFRSVLTALGIIFGVAAVIAMMAIGKGAKKEILDQLKMVGVNNIEITKIIPSQEDGNEEDEGSTNAKKFTPGLTLSDAKSIAGIIPSAQNICPELNTQLKAYHGTAHNSVNLIGTVPSFFDAFHFQISRGQNFSGKQLELGLPVCIIGKNVEAQLFRGSPSLGKYIKCGPHWLQVIGIIEKIGINKDAAKSAQIRNYNNDVYIPIKTFLARFQKDGAELSLAQTSNEDGEETKNKDYHELDRIIVQMGSAELLKPASELLEKMLLRRHNGVADFQIVVPELLLKQEQRSKDIFNWVLLAIAFISLLVGGIGIMNIMLASVYERIKEIGIRMSMGATESDIVMQFLLEAVIISLTGGIIGVFLGIALSFSISIITDITTIISWASVIISFFVSAGVGLIFGIIPARKAAKQDPITSLRHE